MKSVQKKIVGLLKVLAMIVAGVLLGAILITLAYCIPVNQTNAQKSIDSLEGEGWYPSATQLKSSLDTYFHSYLPGVLDGATDGLMLEKATRQIEGNPLWEAMNMEGYTYYWHGYVVILRVLLLFYGLRAIQISQLYIAIDDDVFRCTLYMGEKGAEICAGVTDFLFSYDAYGYVFIIAVQLDFLYSNGVVSFNMLPTYMVYRKKDSIYFCNCRYADEFFRFADLSALYMGISFTFTDPAV